MAMISNAGSNFPPLLKKNRRKATHWTSFLTSLTRVRTRTGPPLMVRRLPAVLLPNNRVGDGAAINRWFPGHPDVEHHPPPGDWCACPLTAGDYPEVVKGVRPASTLAGDASADKPLGRTICTQHSGHRDPVWPRFPAVSAFLFRFDHVTSEAEGPGLHLYIHHQGGGVHGPWVPNCSSAGAQLVICLWGESGTICQTTYHLSLPQQPTGHTVVKLKFLSFKTALLLTLTSMKRVSNL